MVCQSKKLALSFKFGEYLEAFVKDRSVMDLSRKTFIKSCEEDDLSTLHDSFKKTLIRLKLTKEQNDNRKKNRQET